MIGPTKLSKIREQVRKSFNMTDAELFAWFNRQLEECRQKPDVGQAEVDTLRLLRDALAREADRATRKRGRRRVSTVED